MCEFCGRSTCDCRCPNAPDPKTVAICKSCKEPICEGEDMIELDGSYYHDDCFGDCAVDILMEEYGAEKRVAMVEDDEWF